MVHSHVVAAVFGALLGVLGIVSGHNAPIVLVPGIGGSALEAEVNRTDVPAWYCDRKTNGYRLLFLALNEAARPACFVDELLVTYDAGSGRYRNQTGVQIRPLDWGGLRGLRALDPYLPQLTSVYGKLIKGLEAEGYQERVDLFGAPYDFRLAADGLEQVGFGQQFYSLIERAVAANGDQPATVVAHSLGCLVSLYFLSRQEPAWLERNVGSLVAISGPWAGAVSGLKGSISGNNFDIPVVPPGLLRPLQSVAPSGPWLFPAPDLWGDKVLVQTRTQNYTAGDAPQLLRDLGLDQQAAVYPSVHALTWPLPEAAFAVRCLYGSGVGTDEGFFYDVERFDPGEVPPAPRDKAQGRGDGTVGLASLEACSRLGAKASLKAFRGSSHTGLLSEDRLIREVVRTASKRPWPAQLGREVRYAWSDFKGLFLSRHEGDGMPSQPRARDSVSPGCTGRYC